MPSGRTNNFPESGRGLGHVTPTIFGSTVGYSSDSLASCWFLADRRAYATVLRLSSVTLCIVAKRCVLEQKLLLTACRKSNQWPWPLFKGRIKVMSTIALHSTLKQLEIEVWFQRTTNRKCHMGYQMVTWPMMSLDHQRCCEAVESAILLTAWLLAVDARLLRF